MAKEHILHEKLHSTTTPTTIEHDDNNHNFHIYRSEYIIGEYINTPTCSDSIACTSEKPDDGKSHMLNY
jgi:hypothetical protein